MINITLLCNIYLKYNDINILKKLYQNQKKTNRNYIHQVTVHRFSKTNIHVRINKSHFHLKTGEQIKLKFSHMY